MKRKQSAMEAFLPQHPVTFAKRWPVPLVHLIDRRADGLYAACAWCRDGDTAVDDAAELTCEHCKFLAHYRAKADAKGGE